MVVSQLSPDYQSPSVTTRSKALACAVETTMKAKFQHWLSVVPANTIKLCHVLICTIVVITAHQHKTVISLCTTAQYFPSPRLLATLFIVTRTTQYGNTEAMHILFPNEYFWGIREHIHPLTWMEHMQCAFSTWHMVQWCILSSIWRSMSFNTCQQRLHAKRCMQKVLHQAMFLFSLFASHKCSKHM